MAEDTGDRACWDVEDCLFEVLGLGVCVWRGEYKKLGRSYLFRYILELKLCLCLG